MGKKNPIRPRNQCPLRKLTPARVSRHSRYIRPSERNATVAWVACFWFMASPHFKQVGLSWRHVDEQARGGQVAAIAVEFRRAYQVREMPAAAGQVRPGQRDLALGRRLREVDDDHMPRGVGAVPAPGEQVAARLVVGPAGGVQESPGPRSDGIL